MVYSSAYAKITHQGLFDFVQNYDLDLSTIKRSIYIPEFSFDRYEQKSDIFNSNEADDPLPEMNGLNIIVKTGDVFKLNDHRIVCGSFTDNNIVDILMQGGKARIVNCDPPYNLHTNFFSGIHKKDFDMGAGEMTDEQFVEFLASIMKTSIENTIPGSIHYIFMDFRHVWHMTEAAKRTYGNPQPDVS